MQRELEHKGTKTLITDRLILRAFTAEDGPVMYRNWASDPAVTRYLTWPAHESPAASTCLTTLWGEESQKPDCYQWAIVPKQLNEPIGSISVTQINEVIREAEIGYCIGRAWWGQAIMPEALTEVIRFLIQDVGMNRIVAKHDVNNPNSGRVMEKAGMRREGILRSAGKNNQGIVDLAVYAALADDLLSL